MERKWISVKESLPGKAKHLVIVYDPELIHGVTAALFDGKEFRSIADRQEIFKSVTHWMLLPEGPIQEEDENF